MLISLTSVPASVQGVNATQSKVRRRHSARFRYAKQDRQTITSHLAECKKTRALLPSELVTSDELYFRWIKERLDEIEKTLQGIDTERVLVVEKAGEPTDDIFESKLREAIEQIENTSSGVLYCVDKIFENQSSYSTEILDKTRQIRANALTIRRQLKRVTNSIYWFLGSWKFVLVLFVIGFLAIAAVGVYRAEIGKPTVQAVTQQFQKDRNELRKAATNGTGLERVVKVTEQLKEIGQLAPAILVAIAAILTALKTVRTAFQGLKQKN